MFAQSIEQSRPLGIVRLSGVISCNVDIKKAVLERLSERYLLTTFYGTVEYYFSNNSSTNTYGNEEMEVQNNTGDVQTASVEDIVKLFREL